MNSERAKPQRRLSRHLVDRVAPAITEKKKYAFIGISGGAGTTTLALAFAAYLAAGASGRAAGAGLSGDLRTGEAALTAFVELSDDRRPPAGFTYDRIGIDKRFAGREYTSFYGLIAAGRTIRGELNPDAGVNWALRVPGERTERLDTADYIRLADNARGAATVCDVSGSFGNSRANDDERADMLRGVIGDADRIAAIADPLPSALMADPVRLDLLRALEASGATVVWIVNKMNRGVNRKELSRFLGARDPVIIEAIDAEDIYASEYSCETVYERPRAAERLRECFERLASQ